MNNKLENISLLTKIRVRTLKKRIVAQVETKSKFIAEVHLLKLKFQKEYDPFFNKLRILTQSKYEPTKETVAGIPIFFRKNSLIHMQKGEIQPYDVPILKHLTDIRVNRSENILDIPLNSISHPSSGSPITYWSLSMYKHICTTFFIIMRIFYYL